MKPLKIYVLVATLTGDHLVIILRLLTRQPATLIIAVITMHMPGRPGLVVFEPAYQMLE